MRILQFVRFRISRFFRRQVGRLVSRSISNGQLGVDDGLKILECVSSVESPGLIESLLAQKPERNGKPIPWMTFSAISFLDAQDLSGKRFLEIGAGASTSYWKLRGLSGTSLEADPDWIQRVNESLNELPDQSEQRIDVRQVVKSAPVETVVGGIGVDKSELSLVKSTDQLVREYISQADLLVVDGPLRNLCLLLAAEESHNLEMIILDNAERPEYEVGRNALVNKGWREIPFTGLGPLNSYSWTTSIFLRSF